jgi:hypothetical protein
MNRGISARQTTIPLVIRPNRQTLGKSRTFQVAHGLIGVCVLLIACSARLQNPSCVDHESIDGPFRFERIIAPGLGLAGGEQKAEVLRRSHNYRQAAFILDRPGSTIQAKHPEVLP